MDGGRGDKIKGGRKVLLEESIRDLASTLSGPGDSFCDVTFVSSLEMPHL